MIWDQCIMAFLKFLHPVDKDLTVKEPSSSAKEMRNLTQKTMHNSTIRLKLLICLS